MDAATEHISAQSRRHSARIVFMNASTIGTSLILLNSASEAQPNGLANSSDQVGRNLMDHLGGTRVTATVKGFEDKYVFGRRPIDIKLGENEKALMRAAHQDAIDMLTSAGFENIREGQKPEDNMDGIGGRIHEMGTARMGRDPKTSVLNGWNQSHDIPNLFITDGSFMASSAVQNPSLTYMAFSARAANYAADLLQEGAL